MLYLVLAVLISISVSPSTCFAPCQLTVTLTVEPEKDNYDVLLEVDGGAFYRGTGMNYAPYCYLDDGKEKCNYPPKVVQIIYPDVPAGSYEIRATLKKQDGKTWIAKTVVKTITVIESN